MSYQQKKALEIAIRDAMDGMEALASLFAYRRLPDDLEILGIGEAPETEHATAPATAELFNLAEYRRVSKTERRPSQIQTAQKPKEFISKIIVL